MNVANEYTGRVFKQFNDVEYYFKLKKTNDSLVKANERLYNKLKLDFEIPDTINKFVVDSIKIDSLEKYRKFLYMQAKVIGNSVTLPNNYIQLSRGLQQGVTKDLGVLDANSAVVGTVIDVSSKSIGIELKTSGSSVIEHLIKKNSPLPISISQTFPAEANAVLKVYEGESRNPEECTLRGRLELGNPSGDVTVSLAIDFNGVINATVEAKEIRAQLKIKSEAGDIDSSELKARIDDIDMRL